MEKVAEFYHHTGFKPSVRAEVFCKDCEIFTKRGETQKIVNNYFGNYGCWDFSTCYKSCVKDLYKRNY
jgi:hypothetical protein